MAEINSCWNFKFGIKFNLVILVLIYLQGIENLKITHLDIPHIVNISSAELELSCQYDMGNRNLYAVKWYKDESEFYRYSPTIDPKKQMFTTTGISINMNKSNNVSIFLTKLQYSTTGSYKCEVSTDGPDYHTDYQAKNLTIMTMPRTEDPVIVVNKRVIAAHENLEANCSIISNPPATLSWYINDATADSWLLQANNRELHDFGRRTLKSLALKFEVKKEHFKPNNGEQINITCRADIPNYNATNLVHTKLITNLYKSNGQVAAQGSHRGSSTSAHKTTITGAIVSAILIATLRSATSMC